MLDWIELKKFMDLTYSQCWTVLHSFVMISSISIICPLGCFICGASREVSLLDIWESVSLVNSNSISSPFSIGFFFFLLPSFFNTLSSFSSHLPTNINFTSVCFPRLWRSNPWSLQSWDLVYSKPYDTAALPVLTACCFWLKYCFCLKDQKLSFWYPYFWLNVLENRIVVLTYMCPLCWCLLNVDEVVVFPQLPLPSSS